MTHKFDKKAFFAERLAFLNTQFSKHSQFTELQRLLDDARDTILRQYAEIEALKDSADLHHDRAYRMGYMDGWNGGVTGDYGQKGRVANMVRAFPHADRVGVSQV